MQKLILAFALTVFSLILIPTVQAAHVSCDDNITTDTTLDSNLICNGTALTIAADNVAFNCAGFTINYSIFITGNAIFANNRNNVTVNNCNLLQVNSTIPNSHAINFTSVNSSIIQNNIINTTGPSSSGIWLENSYFNTISANNIKTINSLSSGVRLASGSKFNSVTSNTINTFSTISPGIHLSSAESNSVVSNTINTLFGSAYGISLQSSPNATLISNNIVAGDSQSIRIFGTVISDFLQTIGTDNTGNGKPIRYFRDLVGASLNIPANTSLVILGNISNSSITGIGINVEDGLQAGFSDRLIIENNTITGAKSEVGVIWTKVTNSRLSSNIINTTAGSALGVFLISDSNFNNISSNNITTSGPAASGIRLESRSDSNTISSNNVTTSGNSAHGVHLFSDIESNNISSNTITTSGSSGHGIFLEASSDSTSLTSNIISTSLGNNLQIVSSKRTHLLNQLIANYSLSSSGLIVEDAGEGELAFNNETMTASGGNLSADIEIGNNSVFVNSTSQPGFNTTANITLFGITFTNPKPIVDLEDDGTFVDCISPRCVEISFSNGVFVYNVTSFTTYSSNETPNAPPVLQSIGNKTVNESQTLIIQLNATDPDGDILTFGTNAGVVLPSPFNFNSSTGLFQWTPTFNDSGNYSVLFNVTDGILADSETIIITVIDVIPVLACGSVITSNVNLTSDLLNCPGNGLIIGANNIILDGNGHTITGSNSGSGVLLSNKSGVTIKNLNVKFFVQGIFLNSSTNNSVTGNNITTANANTHGILLVNSNNNTISNNRVESFGGAFRLGITLITSSQNAILSNSLSPNAVSFPTALNIGILLHLNSNNNTVSNNIARFSDLEGILLQANSNNNIVSNNNLISNSIGINLIGSSNNNTIRSNTIKNNINAGINITNSNNNSIFNNFFNNTINARDSSINFWNITKTSGINIIGGPFLGGNFWHDYAGVDTNGDGLGDTLLPYNSTGNIINGDDFLPLTTPSIINITNVTFNFNITASPTNQTVRPGGNAAYFIDLTLLNGTPQLVNLTVTVFRNTSNFVEPTIITSFLPPNVLPTGNSTLYLFTADTTPQDFYIAVINATSSTVNRSINVTLTVSGPPLPSNPISQSDFTVKLVTGAPSGNETRINSTGSFILVFTTGSNFSIIDNDATDGVGIIQLLSGNYKLFGRVAGGPPVSSMTVLSPFITGFVSPKSIQLNKTSPPTSVDLTSLNPFVFLLPAPPPIVDNITKPWVSAFYPSTGLPFNFTNNGAASTQLIFVMQ